MNPHPLSKLFPPLSEPDFNELVSDIKKNGLLNPIVTYEGKILDGNHRFKACTVAQVTPRFTEFKQNGVRPVEYVFSQNAVRRHLTKEQKIALAVEMIEALRHGKCKVRNGQGDASCQVGAKLGIGESTLDHASRVYKESPNLFKQVKAGTLTVNRAYRQLKGMVVDAPVKDWRPPKKLYGDWDAFVLLKTMTGDMGWRVAIDGKAGEWRVQFYEKEPLPFDQITPWTGIKAAIQAAAGKVYA